MKISTMKNLSIAIFSLCLARCFTLESNDICGKADHSDGLVVEGEQVKPHEWPWSVAMFHIMSKGELEFKCGGTLITRRKVITAAHCIHQKYRQTQKPRDEILLKLGAFDLAEDELNSVTMKPSNITMHPDWNPFETRYDADIAVMELPNDVTISKYIRPICIWERRRGPPKFSKGIVVGWGISTIQHNSSAENIARKVEIPFVDNLKCFFDQRSFASLSSNRTFCGGARNGQGPCKGDSGSGLYFIHEEKYYLGGIVSASTKDIYDNCNVMNYAIYTEFYKFIPWLSNKKFRETSQSELACQRYSRKRPKKPTWLVSQSSKLQANEIEIGESPHMALLSYDDGNNNLIYGCNGFVVSENFVISAGHCANHRNLKVVRLGAASNKTVDDKGKKIAVDIRVKNQILHENYDSETLHNDIALIELEQPIQFSYFIWPACLYNKMDDSTKLWVAISRQQRESFNYADLKENFLKVPVQGVSYEDECMMAYEIMERFGKLPTSDQFCAKSLIFNLTLCAGSSGAPFQIKNDGSYYIGGIASAGPHCKGDYEYISFTFSPRISAYIEWIEERVWPDE